MSFLGKPSTAHTDAMCAVAMKKYLRDFAAAGIFTLENATKAVASCTGVDTAEKQATMSSELGADDADTKAMLAAIKTFVDTYYIPEHASQVPYPNPLP